MIRGIHPALLVIAVCSAIVPGSVAAQTADPTVDAPNLRVVLPSTVAPLADVYLDGLPLADLADMPSGVVSPYVRVPSGVHHVDLFEDGADPVHTRALATGLMDFGDSGQRTLAVRADGSVVVLDDLALPPSSGASLRLVNLATDAGSVDAWLGDRPITLGLSSAIPSSRLIVDAAAATLTANAPGDRGSVFASGDVDLPAGSATTAFMVPTSERSVWLLASDSAAPPVVAPSPTPTPGPSAGPTASEWRSLPVYECRLGIAYGGDDAPSTTRLVGEAHVRIPAGSRRGIALYHYPVAKDYDPFTDWALGPDGWSCSRNVAADISASESYLTIQSPGRARGCYGLGCESAIGSRSGRYVAYATTMIGDYIDTGETTSYGVPGTTACAYFRRLRTEEPTICRGIRPRTGDHSVPRRSADGTTWLSFSSSRGSDHVLGATGIDCAKDGCLPHLVECKLRPDDRALCEATLQVMLDPARVRIERATAALACPTSAAIIRVGSGYGPPDDFVAARVVRTLRGAHDLTVDSVPVASIGVRYPALCGHPSDRMWSRVRRVDGDRVDGWIAAPLVTVAGT